MQGARCYPPVAQLGYTRPDVLRGCPQQLEDVQQLLQLTVSWEQGLLHTHTKKNIEAGSKTTGTG